MNARRWPILLVPILLAARPEASLELLRQGNSAFQRGDHAQAIALYERALERSTEPELAAFNLATANFHLARAGQSAALGEAETYYRCCLASDNPRRAEALYGLGNCLLLRVEMSRPDAVTLRAAIDRFSECLQDPRCDNELARNARLNQMRARLLLSQLTPRSHRDSDGGDEQSNADNDESPRSKGDEHWQGASGETKPSDGSRDATGKPDKSDRNKGKTSPGRGKLPPIPDQPDAPPLSRIDAEAHLEQAWHRIREDLISHQRGRTRPTVTGVKDW